MSGERVVVIEADLRRPRLHDYLGPGNEIGVTNVLSGGYQFSEALQLVPITLFVPNGATGTEGTTPLHKNLYCVTSGPLPPNPAELASSARMEELLEAAAEVADYVIVDSPPVLLASDALSLARHADAVITTAPLRDTTRDDARRVRGSLDRTGTYLIGVVAMGVKPSSQYYYRYGYYQAARPRPPRRGRNPKPSAGHRACLPLSVSPHGMVGCTSRYASIPQG